MLAHLPRYVRLLRDIVNKTCRDIARGGRISNREFGTYGATVWYPLAKGLAEGGKVQAESMPNARALFCHGCQPPHLNFRFHTAALRGWWECEIARPLPLTFRCEKAENGTFQISAGSVYFSEDDSLFSSETWVNAGIRSQKSVCLNEINVRKPFATYVSQMSEVFNVYYRLQDIIIWNHGFYVVLISNALPDWTDEVFFLSLIEIFNVNHHPMPPLPLLMCSREVWRQKTRRIQGTFISMIYCIPQHFLNWAPTGLGPREGNTMELSISYYTGRLLTADWIDIPIGS